MGSTQERLPSYGGQALIEGVLMRGSYSLAAAFRLPDNSINIETEDLPRIYHSRLKKIPLLRGLIILWDALALGMRYLSLSANLQVAEEERITPKAMTLTVIISLALGIGLFFLLPALVGGGIEAWLKTPPWLTNLIEGAVRLAIVIGYLVAIRKMEDIKRVFMYHGAEHKTINAFEDHAELTPESVNRYTTYHPRCGTGFLISLVLLSILFFTLLGPMPLQTRLLTRLVTIPLLAAVSYEWIRFTAAHMDNPLIRILVKPNLWAQRLTTIEPSLEMLEVAIASFTTMFRREQELAPAADAVRN